MRLALAGVVALVSVVGYCSTRSTNPVTGRAQYVALSPQQEVALGLQAAPEMARQFGGLHPDDGAQRLIDDIGQRLLNAEPGLAGDYPFEFHLLADPETVNAFALPGGQIFITAALFNRLETRGQLAGVLGHEIGHVLARHSAEQMAKANLSQGLTGAVAVGASDYADPRMAAAVASQVAGFINLSYGRDAELESDRLGVRFLVAAGYDPRAMITVMEVLRDASGGSPGRPEFMSTHPHPESRIEQLNRMIAEQFPQGLPEGLEP